MSSAHLGIAAVVIVSVCLVTWRWRANNRVREEIKKRLRDSAKEHLITGRLVREARRLLRSGADFHVEYDEASKGTWNYQAPSFTDGGSHDYAVAYQRAYEEQYLAEHDVDSESEAWGRWSGGHSERLRLVPRGGPTHVVGAS